MGSSTFSSKTGWATSPNELALLLERLKRKGQAILDLSVSNPTQVSFKYLHPTLFEAFGKTKNLVYEPDPHGLKDARRSIQDYYAEKGISLSKDQIFLTANTSEAYSFVFRLLTVPGDTLLAPQPSYPILDYLADLHDLKLLRYPLDEARNWQTDHGFFQNLDWKKIRVLLVVHPNNPSGNYVSENDQRMIEAFSKELSIPVIADEVFFDYTLKEKFQPKSFAGSENILTFTLSGISKVLGLPQMKLSWIIVSGPEEARKEAIRRLEIISDTYLSVSTPIQHALPDWMEKREAIQHEILTRLGNNLKKLRALSAGQNQVKVYEPEGGWVAVLELPDHRSDEAWALEILQREKVLVHPGYFFDFEKSPYLVLSLLTREDIFEEGVRKLIHSVSE
ncbi:MAG: pyridoxal phosphate-dependent aminotransferase [Candidatus Omnitrophica bacterium]|nr:pyridoxal phosphate-dependent aminotransferase [Candidatus Omnitrophota bacterium]